MAEYAIFAGKGDLPKIVFDELKTAKVICFEGEFNSELKPDLLTKFGRIGEVLDFLTANNVKKIIFAGAMHRPDIKKLSLDSEGTKLLAKVMAASLFGKSVGDDKLLSTITKYLETKGFEVVGADSILGNLRTTKGAIGAVSPDENQQRDIEIGRNILSKTGDMDIGQAIVVENGIVIAIEAVEGTAAMIARAGQLKKSYGGVLVKTAKTGQDKRVDLPAIGIETIDQLNAAGIAGVALEAGGSMIIGKEKVVARANELHKFILGI